MKLTYLNNISKPDSIEEALSDLRLIVTHRVQSHLARDNFNFSEWISETFNGNLLKDDLIKHLPVLPSEEECIILMLSIVPHVQPNFFESIITEYLPSGGDFPEFGGVKGTNHRGILATGETVQFVLAGNDISERLKVQDLFREDHFFYRQGILWLEAVKEGEPLMSGRIVMSQEWVDKILFGKESIPRFGVDFPAKRITSEMEWEDAVLHPYTMQQVNDISTWLHHHRKLFEDENLKRKVKPGYRVLFYGPSGTGKTLTAALLGKQFKKDVYRIDLSQIVSKYIGETEKNLEGVFHRAGTKDWILFFDEADALFGKRTSVQSAHDKYANQEVSYLLQRVEDYPGLLILASNFKNNLDEAFIRRFHAVVHFPMPDENERKLLWEKSLPANLRLHPSVDLKEIALQYEMSGAAILNAIQYAALQTYSKNKEELHRETLIDGIRKEFMKEEKSI